MKFLCVGVNPAFDITLTLGGLELDRVNRVRSERRDAAGKSVNVARELISLGCDCELLLLLGRDNSAEFLSKLAGIPTAAHCIDGATRENLTLLCGGDTIKINRAGANVTAQNISEFTALLPDDMSGYTAVFSGSMPSGMTPEDYLRLINEAIRRGARAAVDTAALSREQILRLRPWLYKPNEHELAQLCGAHDMREDELLAAAKELACGGVGTVLLTLGARGLAAVTASETVRIDAAPVCAVNTVGAGDCALAGFLAQSAQGSALAQCAAAAAQAGERSVCQQSGE